MSEETAGEEVGPVSPQERRRFVRVRKEVRLTCRLIGEPTDEPDVPARNVGTGGLLISTRRELPPGTRLLLRAAVEADGIEFTVGGRVVWSRTSAVHGYHDAGVCFVGLDPIQRRNVLTLIGKAASGDDGAERRQYIRLKKRLRVEYRVAGRLFGGRRDAYSQDLSLGGLAVVLAEQLNPSAHLEMNLHLDDGQGKPLNMEGVVLEAEPLSERGPWNTRVCFRQLPDAVRARLAAYISRMLTARPMDAGPAGEL